MSFKTSKICAVLAGQGAWLAATFVLFGGLSSPNQTAPWMAILAMFFLLPLTGLLWAALTVLGAIAGRTNVKPMLLYPLGAALAAPVTLGVLGVFANTLFIKTFEAVITRAELATFAAASAIPGLVAGLFLARFGAPAPVAPPAARPIAPPVVAQTAAKLSSFISGWKPPARLAPLLLPNLRADAAQFLAAASLLTIGVAGLLVLNFLRVLGGPVGSASHTLMLVGQAAFLWCVICLFANRLRGLGRSPFWALAPAALAALFVLTGPADAAEWQAPLSMLLVYAIAGAVLCTFNGDAAPAAPARSFGMRQSQTR